MSHSFKIPSLRDLKKQQETAVVSSTFRRPVAATPAPPSSITAVASTSSASRQNATNIGVSVTPAKSKAIFNPYAKKKSTTPISSAANIKGPSASTKQQTTVANNNTSVTKNDSTFNNKPPPHKNLQQQKQQSRPPPPPVGPFTTFSQAFGDENPDSNFGEEELAQQRAFDEELSCSKNEKSTNSNNDTTNSSNSESSVQQIAPRDHHTMLQPHILHISTRQRGNPLIAHIRNVPYQFSPMVPDYIFATTRCALFLSLRYHNLHPNYIHRRIAELKSDFELRILLCHVDVEDNTTALLFLNDLCVQNNLTLILSWSEEEAARYLETFRAFDGKDASSIQKREHTNYIDQVSHVLGSVRSVNKTDSVQLISQFGCWKNLVSASLEELSVCPGVGVKKVKRMAEAFRMPFSKEARKRRKMKAMEKEKEQNEGNEEEDEELEMDGKEVLENEGSERKGTDGEVLEDANDKKAK